MSDPFRPETNKQFLREARFGLTILAVTLGIFSYVAYKRITGSGTELPEYVLRAPIAESVWPGEDPPIGNSEESSFGANFGNMIAGARKTFGLDLKRESGPKSVRSRSKFADPTPELKTAQAAIRRQPKRKPPTEFDLKSVQRQSFEGAQETALADFNATAKSLPNLPLDVNDLRPRKNSDDSVARTSPEGLEQPAKPKSIDASTVFETTGHNSLPRMPADIPDLNSQANDFGPIAPRDDSSTRSATTNQDFDPTNTFVTQGRREFIPSRVTSDVAGDLKRPFTSRQVESREIALSSYDRKIAKAESATLDATVLHTLTPESETSSIKQPEDLIQLSDEYAVQAGDSFWAIAQRTYDDGRFFRALYEYNRKRVGSFENLGPGITIATPPKAELVKLWPDLCPKADNGNATVSDIGERIYVTKSGDTLFEIARQRLGQASRYLEILTANQNKLSQNVSHLTPLPEGVKLIIPYRSPK